MSLPTHLSPSSSFSGMRTKFNQLTDEFAVLRYGNLEDIRFTDDCNDILGWNTYSIDSDTFLAISGTGDPASSPTEKYYGIVSSQKTGTMPHQTSCVSKQSFSLSSDTTWEFHSRFNMFWNPATDTPTSSLKFQLGLSAKAYTGGTVGTPTAISSNANSFYLECTVTNGTLASVILNGPSLSGTVDWTSYFSGYAGAVVADTYDRWDVLSFKVLPGYLMTAYLNGIPLATATLGVNSRTLKWSAYRTVTGSGSIQNSLNVDYISTLSTDLRQFIPI